MFTDCEWNIGQVLLENTQFQIQDFLFLKEQEARNLDRMGY
jgi:hypothetical protein